MANLASEIAVPGDLARSFGLMQLLLAAISAPRLAEYYGKRSVCLAETTDDLGAKTLAFETRGVYLVGVGRWAEARIHLEMAQSIAVEIGDRRRWIEITCALSTLSHYLGNFSDRVVMSEGIYEAACGTGDRQGQIWGLLDQVESLLPLGDYHAAEKRLVKVGELFTRPIGNAEEIWWLGLLATFEWATGRYDCAEGRIAKAWMLCPKRPRQ